jgi:phosphoglycolate phosphatase-like HAD superfamily hydrolase
MKQREAFVMSNIKVVIFDCDGVIFDSRLANVAFYNEVLEHFGKPKLTDTQLRYVHMHTAEESIDFLFREDERLADAQRYRLSMDYTPFSKYIVLEPNLLEILGYLRPRFKIALCTNRSTSTDTVLRYHELTTYFDMVVSALDVKNPKPHPEPIVRILNNFGIGSHEAIYIGDSEVDEKAANGAGVMFVSYKNRDLKAAHHIDNLRELREILTGVS